MNRKWLSSAEPGPKSLVTRTLVLNGYFYGLSVPDKIEVKDRGRGRINGGNGVLMWRITVVISSQPSNNEDNCLYQLSNGEDNVSCLPSLFGVECLSAEGESAAGSENNQARN